MSKLLFRSIPEASQAPIPCLRNRIAAQFPALTGGEFQDVARVIQPIFQAAGFAPEILLRAADGTGRYRPANVNATGPFGGIALAQVLYDPLTRQATGPAEMERFLGIVNKASAALAEGDQKKGWFGKRRSSAETAIRAVPALDKAPEAALAQAAAWGQFFRTLPDYQRTLRLGVTGAPAVGEDELQDFAEYVGYGEPAFPGLWYDARCCTILMMNGSEFSLSLPCLPRTPLPDQTYENLTDVAKRFVMEFGGRLEQDANLAAQMIIGWKNVLARVSLAPGDEEAREFFPFSLQ